MTENNKITLNKIICTQCKTKLMIRPTEKKCPVCGGLLPHAVERSWRIQALARMSGLDHLQFPAMVRKWKYSFVAKPAPSVEALSDTEWDAVFGCAFCPAAGTIYVSAVRWSFFLCLISSRSIGHLARLPSPDISAHFHLPSRLLSPLLASTLKWYFS